ncbi:sperm-associated antigen 17 isoform X1 [Silurus asotus]|uniref:Sperm-associated antigen 17 isoform X1 n=1 Tax=Silurus asotus TaxID=30991 RepID=A0AAD5FJH3_SILAS|nr:sperm-associated antigen 17 isoform X1 [Silurus asotus]
MRALCHAVQQPLRRLFSLVSWENLLQKHYVLMTGFHQPSLISALDSIGVHVSNVIRLKSDSSQISHVAREEGNTETTEEQELTVGVGELQQDLSVFWDQLDGVLNSAGFQSRLSDVARLDYTLEKSEVFVGEDSLKEDDDASPPQLHVSLPTGLQIHFSFQRTALKPSSGVGAEEAEPISKVEPKQQVMMTRDDGVMCVSGKHKVAVDHADGTRMISSFQQRETQSLQNSGSSDGGKRSRVKVEKSGFATVIMNCEEKSGKVLFRDGTTISATAHGSYRVSLPDGGCLSVCKDGVAVYSSTGPEGEQRGRYIMSHSNDAFEITILKPFSDLSSYWLSPTHLDDIIPANLRSRRLELQEELRHRSALRNRIIMQYFQPEVQDLIRSIQQWLRRSAPTAATRVRFPGQGTIPSHSQCRSQARINWGG